MRCSRWLGGWATALLLAVAPVAQAAPVLSGASGLVGQTVAFKVSGPTALFASADIVVNYDPTVLRLSGLGPDLLFPQPQSFGGVDGALVISLAPFPAPVSGPDYFDLLFEILSRPSSGNISVSVYGDFYFDIPGAVPDFRIESVSDTDPLQGTVTISSPQGNDVPIGGTSGLVMSGLALLALTRRRRVVLQS
jgi:MYXO-CTERM domain-containing protein